MRTIVEHIDIERLVPGGIDTCITDLIANADDDSIRVVGITSSELHSVGQWVDVEVGQRVVKFMPVARFDRTRRSGFRIPDSLKFAIGLARLRKKVRSDVIQTHRIETGAISLLLGFGPVLQFIHNNGVALLGDKSDSAWRHMPRLYRLLESIVLSRALGVVLFNAVDADRVRSLRSDTKISTTWYDQNVFFVADDKRDVYCWVGRFEAQKDPLLAARAFVELCRRDKTAVCVMAGEGTMLPAVSRVILESGYEARIKLPGRLERTEVARLFRRSSAALLTSHYEGSPRVLFESLACGAPMVATDESDPDRMLVPSVNGVRAGRDPSALADGLAGLAGLAGTEVAASVRQYSANVVAGHLLTFKMHSATTNDGDTIPTTECEKRK